MLRKTLLTSVVSLLLATSVYATPINVAEGAAVTLNGSYGMLRAGSPWIQTPLAAPSSLTDGIFLPRATDWNAGSIWWDEALAGSAGNSIEIDLGGIFSLIGFKVQADDNDSYLLEYWDGLGWAAIWNIPIVGGYGDQVRPNPDDPSEIYMLGNAIHTDRLRFSATGGDRYYSVTEIQAFAVPEPGTLALLGIGLFGMGLMRRKKV